MEKCEPEFHGSHFFLTFALSIAAVAQLVER